MDRRYMAHEMLDPERQGTSDNLGLVLWLPLGIGAAFIALGVLYAASIGEPMSTNIFASAL